MSRKIKSKDYILKIDFYFPRLILGILITHLLKDGKLSIAQKIAYKMIKFLNQKTLNNGFIILEKAIKNVSPRYYTKHTHSRKKTEITCELLNLYNSTNLAIKWILQSAKKQDGSTFSEKICNEILAASKFFGQTLKKKNEFHNEAEMYKLNPKTIYHLQKREKKRAKILQMGEEAYKNFKIRFVKPESFKRMLDFSI